MSATKTYLDLLRPDGSVNRAVFEAILASRVINEINLRLCVSAGIRAPDMRLGDIAAWRAEQVKAHNLGPISDAQRTRITAEHRRELNEWASVMSQAAQKQHAAMDAAFVQAAE